MSTTIPQVIRLSDSAKVTFDEYSYYQPILDGEAGGFPIFAGIQTAEPGYQTPAHKHPYVEVLHILDGVAEAWIVGKEEESVHLRSGDTIALPADELHVFRVAGDETLRLLGTHLSSQRVVDYDDGSRVVMGAEKRA